MNVNLILKVSSVCLKISTVAEHLCDIGANEIELFRDSDYEGRFATGVSGLEFILLIFQVHGSMHQQ
jgi:hypothetical protein